MSKLSDDESSDSSTEFLIPAHKIDLNSSFFDQLEKKPSRSKAQVIESSEDSNDEFDYIDENNVSSSELLSQVLKNLESNKKNQTLIESVASSSTVSELESKNTNHDLSNEINNLLIQGENKDTLTKEESDAEEKNESVITNYEIPEKGIQVHFPGQSLVLDKKNKKKQDLQKLLQNKINQRIRSCQVFIHKVGLLIWLSHGFFLNKLANEPDLLGIALSLVSSNNYPKGRTDLKYLEKFTKWFTGMFKICEENKEVVYDKKVLLQRITDKKIYNYVELVLLYICTLRGMGINCRLVISLQPPPLKPKPNQLFKAPTNEENDKMSSTKCNEKISAKKTTKNKGSTNNKATTSKKKIETRKKVKLEENKPVNSKTKAKNSKTSSDVSFSSDEEEFFSSDEEYKVKKPLKKKLKTAKQNKSIKTPIAKKLNKHRKLLSSDEDEQNNFKNINNIWAEVYLESEESWISVNVLDQKIHCVSEIYKKAGHPVLYIVAWNSVGTLKDVTRRYCPHWLTVTRKKRVDENWWSDTLHPWKEKKTAISKAEDKELLQKELEQPLPKTVSECKGHPLYALIRHLLKFEALYPPDAVPLGFLKTGEAIYSRHCVHTLYSRETWVKKARVVKPAQEPYKIVKAMPKYDKLSGTKIKDQPLELFGKWQTGPYVPPEAKDGKIPRNEYGNVDLFKMCMLPKGTVYLNLPGLNRISRKLNIDCAPACTGFSFGCRGALPVFEGFVVCKEYENIIVEAWEEEQIEAEKRAKEKVEKRIYGNWKKLIKGLLIKQKISAKYNFGEEEIYEDKTNISIPKTVEEYIEEKKKTVPKMVTRDKKNNSTPKTVEENVEENNKTVSKMVTRDKKNISIPKTVEKNVEENNKTVSKMVTRDKKNISITKTVEDNVEENNKTVSKMVTRDKKNISISKTVEENNKTESKMVTRASKRIKSEPDNPKKKRKR